MLHRVCIHSNKLQSHLLFQGFVLILLSTASPINSFFFLAFAVAPHLLFFQPKKSPRHKRLCVLFCFKILKHSEQEVNMFFLERRVLCFKWQQLYPWSAVPKYMCGVLGTKKEVPTSFKAYCTSLVLSLQKRPTVMWFSTLKLPHRLQLYICSYRSNVTDFASVCSKKHICIKHTVKPSWFGWE